MQLTFNAILPDTTSAENDTYMGGSVISWNPAGKLMERTDLFATMTLSLYEGYQLVNKHTRGSWETIEKGAAREEITNRVVNIVYGTDSTMVVNDTVQD